LGEMRSATGRAAADRNPGKDQPPPDRTLPEPPATSRFHVLVEMRGRARLPHNERQTSQKKQRKSSQPPPVMPFQSGWIGMFLGLSCGNSGGIAPTRAMTTRGYCRVPPRKIRQINEAAGQALRGRQLPCSPRRISLRRGPKTRQGRRLHRGRRPSLGRIGYGPLGTTSPSTSHGTHGRLAAPRLRGDDVYAVSRAKRFPREPFSPCRNSSPLQGCGRR